MDRFFGVLTPAKPVLATSSMIIYNCVFTALTRIIGEQVIPEVNLWSAFLFIACQFIVNSRIFKTTNDQTGEWQNCLRFFYGTAKRGWGQALER